MTRAKITIKSSVHPTYYDVHGSTTVPSNQYGTIYKSGIHFDMNLTAHLKEWATLNNCNVRMEYNNLIKPMLDYNESIRCQDNNVLTVVRKGLEKQQDYCDKVICPSNLLWCTTIYKSGIHFNVNLTAHLKEWATLNNCNVRMEYNNLIKPMLHYNESICCQDENVLNVVSMGLENEQECCDKVICPSNLLWCTTIYKSGIHFDVNLTAHLKEWATLNNCSVCRGDNVLTVVSKGLENEQEYCCYIFFCPFIYPYVTL
jgi:hypothetical protein